MQIKTFLDEFGFIFARAGSKGIKDKNIQELGGRTLLEISIDAMTKRLPQENIFVSSDSKEILEKAKTKGVQQILRPWSLAQDESPEFDSWKHAIEFVRCERGVDDFLFVNLPTTCPFRSAKDVNLLIDSFYSNHDGVHMGIVNSRRSPDYNIFTKDKRGTLTVAKTTTKNLVRRQESDNYFDATTCGYVSSAIIIQNAERLSSLPLYGVAVSPLCSIDIDTPDDLSFAKIVHSGLVHLKKND